MPYPPNLRTPTQVKILAALKTKAQASQDALDAVLGAKNNEDERMIAETDAFVADLIKTL
jgi:lambda repressor-like predicted transcriptional regulator